MPFKKSLLLVGLSSMSLLTACGGGGGSESSTAPVTVTPDVDPVVTNNEPAQVTDKYDTVKGLYDASRGENKQYYFIGADGVLTAYNYLGDGVDAGDNCYRESTAEETNGGISGVTLEALDSGDFVINVGGTGVTLEMTGDEITKIRTAGISVGGSMSISLNGISISITPDRATDLSIADIESMLCQ
ncbi:hypothetical protein [Gilvimarinus polysaccharolyticus]|uniref:hypothetical protein n=1 Tax=Gilvimarinus polysaccharolyticus TaxID=863921 RepID=UPI0006733B0C|nr:hypothetical protein [Gilvimarinus polysaccharolyticus]